ncbi:MAG: transposase [Propionivibrio sp.]|nr:transposase [Propionivibrio sp.]
MDTNVSVVLPSRRRRRHAPEFKARVIAACLQPGASLAAVALANGLNANFLRTWVKAHRNQDQGASVPVVKSDLGAASAPRLVPVAVQRSNEDSPGSIELEIRRQQTVVQIRWPASEATACAQWLRDLLR